MKTKKENSDDLENLLKHSKENLVKYTQERVLYVYACFADILYTEKRKSCKLSRKQIIKVLKASNNLLAKNTPVDILQQLEDETGVILKLDDNDKETYAKLCGIADKLHDLSYLENNSDQCAYFLQRKDSWLTMQLYSCILLSLHQLYGFGYSRIETVLTDVMLTSVKDTFANALKKYMNEYPLQQNCYVSAIRKSIYSDNGNM